MKPDLLVDAENVSKRFCRSLKRSLWYGVRDIASELLGYGEGAPELRRDEFWAVENATFQLRRGECVGVIGRNGAGKTTLLKMLNGLIKPDGGQIRLYGKVGGLIALGAGFSPILTGRENIYINGAVLGKTRREIDARFDEIVEFSEIGEFIDSPVQSYSSGMQVRLGFAIAAVLVQPDILLLDEVLAVGDMGFIIKCLNKVREIAKNSAVVFVSHSMQFVSSFCNRILFMKNGRIGCDTQDIALGMDYYMREFPVSSNLSGSGEARISNIQLRSSLAQDDAICDYQVKHGDTLHLTFDVDVEAAISRCTGSLVLRENSTQPVFTFPISRFGDDEFMSGGFHSFSCALENLELSPGVYSFVIAFWDASTKRIVARLEGATPFRVVGKEIPWTAMVRPVVLQRLDSEVSTRNFAPIS